MNDLIAGAVYPFRALSTINHNRQLWGYVVGPILLNILVGVTIYAALLFAGFRAIDGWVASFPAWLQLLGTLLRVLLIVLLLIATGFVLVRFGVVLGSPFYSKLSERLEFIRTGRALPNEPFSLAFVVRDLSRSVLFELQKLLLFGGVGLALLLANLIPVAGQIVSTVGWITLGATIACLDFFDPPLERRRLNFRQKLGLVRRHFPASAGFGLVCLGLVSIPLVNLLSIPLCITAGTLFFCDRMGRGAVPFE